MNARRCSLCGISYPFNHPPECEVCEGKLDNIADKPDSDWKETVELRKQSREARIERDRKVHDWTLLQFMNMGFSKPASELLATWKVDHHRVTRMIAAGCERTLVLDIFRPDILPPSAEAEPVQEAAAAVQ